MIRRILAAVDGSARAPGVLAMAQELGARLGAPVHLFRVVDVPPEIPAGGHQAQADPLVPAVTARVMAQLRELAVDYPLVMIEPPLLSQESPWRAILETAERLDVDLIVIGSHGYHGWDRLLGTNAGKVGDHARRHVLIVHGNED